MAKTPIPINRFAIPNIHRAFALLTVLTFVLTLTNDEFIGILVLDPGAILKGEVWRILTGFLLPGLGSFGGSGSLIFAVIILLIKVQLLFFMGDALQAAWGVRRFNVVFFGTILAVNISSLIAHSISPVMGLYLGITTFIFLYLTIYFAFASEHPDYEFLIMFVLPIKAKWIAIGLAAITLYRGVSDARQFEHIYPFIHVLLCFAPFLAIALPRLINHSKQAHRRTSFKKSTEKARQIHSSGAFHNCSVCQVSDIKDPTRVFRVLDNGDEICEQCLKQRQSAS